jgi:hypothetical protein
MKIRNGFVSNSSSSSFILKIPKDSFEDWEKSLSKVEKELLDEVGGRSTQIILGIECVEISRAMGHSEGMFDYIDVEGDECLCEIWEEMMEKLPEKATYIYI